MVATQSKLQGLSLCLGALGVVASAAGCVVRVGAAGDAAQATTGNATYDAARADWAKKQQAFDAAFAEEIKAFHAMEADLQHDDAPAEVVTRAEELRARFLKRCSDESGWSTDACWNGTFVRDVTLALAKIRFRGGDLLSAAVEAYTIENARDLRAEDEKIWKAQGLSCKSDMFAGRHCSTFQSDYDAALHPKRPELTPELRRLTSSTTEHDKPVDWRGGDDITAVTKTGASAVVTIKPWKGSIDDSRTCGDAEWRLDGSGNKVLVRPCQTSNAVSPAVSYPPAVVPTAELGDFKLSRDTDLLLVYSPKGKHAGHVVATSIFSGETTDRGIRIFKRIMFRGLPVKDAKPGYP